MTRLRSAAGADAPAPVGPADFLRWLFAPPGDAPARLWPRWIWLRVLGAIYFSAFYSLAFQIRGLVGDDGILPASAYLAGVRAALPDLACYWDVPTIFWLGAGNAALQAGVIAGLLAATFVMLNLVPRVAGAVCLVLFLSCISVLQDFSSYQSDGMLLEAGFLSLFYAPPGARPGLGAEYPPSRASLWLLRWEWFRIYFESGVVKLLSGDPQWRTLTAMDHYYENGPLPAWPGWYVQHLPHAYHAATALLTLLLELAFVWIVFLGRRGRILCFLVVTPFQLGIIATANYAFLNHLVLCEGVLLLDDAAVARVVRRLGAPAVRARRVPRLATIVLTAAALTVAFAATLAAIPGATPLAAVLAPPARWLAPFRVANGYGLFASMTTERDDIEFQGSNDGRTWIAYPFRYKPQDVREHPGFYAPYQPRFDWNLWFASLGPWRASPWVVLTQARLLAGSPSVLALFRADPFQGHPPRMVRTVLWRYRFSTEDEKRATGRWWDRELLGPFSGVLAPDSTGVLGLSEAP